MSQVPWVTPIIRGLFSVPIFIPSKSIPRINSSGVLSLSFIWLLSPEFLWVSVCNPVAFSLTYFPPKIFSSMSTCPLLTSARYKFPPYVWWTWLLPYPSVSGLPIPLLVPDYQTYKGFCGDIPQYAEIIMSTRTYPSPCVVVTFLTYEWNFPVNYPVFTVFMVIYHYVDRIG